MALSDLQKIKPTSKKELMQNWDAICCAKNITKAIAEQHTNDYREGKVDNPFHQQNYYFVSTGGSSGLRGLFIWDLNYLPILSCATHRYRWKDQKSTVTSPARIAIITAPSFLHGSKTLFSVSFEEDLCQLRLSSETAVSEICEALNNFQPTHIIGFTSVIGELATQALRGQLAIQPAYISPNSEPLDDETRDNIRKAWSIEVHNMWGSVEMGISGVEDDEHIGLKLSEDLCIYETVDENLNPTDDPEQVKKLLVTNLYNYSLPLIRYVVDDTLEIKKSDDCAYRLVTAIKGRADDWFNYGDIRIHPMTFRHVFGQDQNIIEYQVKQTVKGADIFLICDGQANTDELMFSTKTSLARIVTNSKSDIEANDTAEKQNKPDIPPKTSKPPVPPKPFKPPPVPPKPFKPPVPPKPSKPSVMPKPFVPEDKTEETLLIRQESERSSTESSGDHSRSSSSLSIIESVATFFPSDSEPSLDVESEKNEHSRSPSPLSN